MRLFHDAVNSVLLGDSSAWASCDRLMSAFGLSPFESAPSEHFKKSLFSIVSRLLLCCSDEDESEEAPPPPLSAWLADDFALAMPSLSEPSEFRSSYFIG